MCWKGERGVVVIPETYTQVNDLIQKVQSMTGVKGDEILIGKREYPPQITDSFYIYVYYDDRIKSIFRRQGDQWAKVND